MGHSLNRDGSQDASPGNRRQWLWWTFWSILVVLGIVLGIWQWERADDKREYLARLDAAPRLESPAQTPPDGSFLTLTGTYLAAETLFLDNRTFDGRLGVAPLTPFEDENGRFWLIQRGFLETGTSRETPQVETPDGRVTLAGRWQTANEGTPVFGENREGQRLQRMALDAWSSDFAHDGWLHLEQGPGHLESWWTPSVMPPSRHLGYAVQWWGLSLAALVVMLVGSRRFSRRIR
ncbi:SURF1 family protein [Halomonas urumqiensis]|uniref:SURF1-like protein n=1 Tax=Halomonas urumqiensis TaxID=1684789 RepID=A0A2N7UPQ7_9GAMM|nr:SURF1 family protein [Halomonas urumqiensis]PMR82428.1 SURF1 family protein [Halomonas urumqiensis]PTB04091.1 SURF1 family protein [Halomonas urumqiensis]GHE19644.1 SURF1-like protein [Halomonas urumqiensis]